jgi:hypothetical protein
MKCYKEQESVNKGLFNESPSASIAHCSLLRMKNEGAARGQSASCLANEQLTMEDVPTEKACLSFFIFHLLWGAGTEDLFG